MTYQSFAFTEIGGKDNQEDSLWPAPTPDWTSVGNGVMQYPGVPEAWILCDGMGGHENGEAASRTAADAIGNALSRYAGERDQTGFTEEEILKAVDAAYDALDGLEFHSSRKPGTTLAMVAPAAGGGMWGVHIGDSRVYHLRPDGRGSAEILYRSWDHSLVNALVKAGEITEEEARCHPRRNVITRAMQPAMPKRDLPEIKLLPEILLGDILFVCCDGVLEQTDDEALRRIAGSAQTPAEKMKEIKALCDRGTRDNYTAWMVAAGECNPKPKGFWKRLWHS